jgi:DNA replication and repair protein RecF
MKLNKLQLLNFRNHVNSVWEFDTKTIINGANGSGKSNVLEAINLLAAGKSFRADTDNEMVRYGSPSAWIKGLVVSQNGELELQAMVHDGSTVGIKKKFYVNGIPKRGVDFTGSLKAVTFSPEDMELLTGSPSRRRKYLDFVISQKDREYRRSLISYEKGVRQRNRLLEKIREGEAERGQMFFWDRLLIKNGNFLTDKRHEFINYLSSQIIEGENKFRCIYDKSEISEARLLQYETAEIAAATTLVGPHRDDFWIEMEDADQENNFVNVAKFGSRGEQRMAILWLKKGEFNYLNENGDCPILLLDDIFSELDHKHRKVVEEVANHVIGNGGQVIMTTADEHMVPKEGWKIIKLTV